MPVDSEKMSVSSSATTLSDKSSTDTLVELEALNGAATGKEKVDSAEKSGSNDPSTTAKAIFEKPARAHASSKGLEPFLYANWGWGGPPCIDFPDAELRRERKKWEDEKKSSK